VEEEFLSWEILAFPDDLRPAAAAGQAVSRFGKRLGSVSRKRLPSSCCFPRPYVGGYMTIFSRAEARHPRL